MQGQTRELAEKFAKEYEGGKSIRQIAADNHVSHNYVWLLLRAIGAKLRPQSHDIQTRKLAEMREGGMSYRDIARETGMSTAAVYQRLNPSGNIKPTFVTWHDVAAFADDVCKALGINKMLKSCAKPEGVDYSLLCEQLGIRFDAQLFHPVFNPAGGRKLTVTNIADGKKTTVSAHRGVEAVASDIRRKLINTQND